MRIAIAQINTTVGDLAGNRRKIAEAALLAKERGAELVTFPELAITGYPPEDLLFQERFVTDNLRALRALLPVSRGLWLVVGFVDRDRRGFLYNSAAVLAGQKIVRVYHKVELPNYGVFDEKRYFRPGNHECLIELGHTKLGLTICEDIWQKESFVYHKGKFKGASVLVNISASPYHLGKQKIREGLLRDLAKRVGCPVVYHNLVGGQDELVFDGGSMLVDASGRILGQAKRFEEDFFVTDLEIHARHFNGRRGGFRPMTEEEEVYKALVLGTRDYILKNGFQKALIGLSGGIDSALVARIAVDALGQENVIGMTMPSPYTSSQTYKDAQELARRLGIRCLEIKITGILKSYLGALREAFQGQKPDITEENLQARIRGNILMALSNKFGYLVLTTGNKSEMATGYCTLYGDMAGGFAVIKDVPKTLVYRLVRYRNKLRPRDPIPASIVKRPPTAELRPNQKDRDTLPPYPLLDKFLHGYVERDLSLRTLVQKGIPRNTAERVARMVDRNEYKRRQAPPGVKITPKAFGRDRRMPITSRYTS